MSTNLTNREKREAMEALEGMLNQIRCGEIADFRMIIRGQQRATHSNSKRFSGRARELHDKGFYFLRYHPKGSSRRTFGTFCPKTRRSANATMHPTPEDSCRIPLFGYIAGGRIGFGSVLRDWHDDGGCENVGQTSVA